MASPENNIKWAEAAVAGDLSFPGVEQDGGYQVGEDYPNSQKNQYTRDAARWSANGFATLGDFVRIADAGQIGVVNSFDFTQSFGASVDTAAPYAGLSHACDSDGRFVFFLEGNPAAGPGDIVRLRAYDREDLSTIVADVTPGVGNLLNDEYIELVCNGSHVAICINDSAAGAVTGHVELYTWDPAVLTLTLEWTWTDTAAIVPFRDIAMDHEAVYIAHQTSADDSKSGRRILFSAGTGGASLTNGAEQWNSAHTSNLSAVDTNGFYVVFGGETDPLTWRVTDIAGNAIDSGGAGVNDEIDPRQIVVRHDRWYRVVDNAGTREYWVRGFYAGLSVEEVQLTYQGAAAPDVDLQVDDRYLLTGVGGELTIVDVRTGIVLARFAVGAAGAATDADTFFLASSSSIQRRHRGTGARTWRRVASTDQNLAMRQLAISEES